MEFLKRAWNIQVEQYKLFLDYWYIWVVIFAIFIIIAIIWVNRG